MCVNGELHWLEKPKGQIDAQSYGTRWREEQIRIGLHFRFEKILKVEFLDDIESIYMYIG